MRRSHTPSLRDASSAGRPRLVERAVVLSFHQIIVKLFKSDLLIIIDVHVFKQHDLQ